MNRRGYIAVAISCVALFLLVASILPSSMNAQVKTQVKTKIKTAPKHVGAVQDWSQGHIVFSRNALAKHPDLIDREPRIKQEIARRWGAPKQASLGNVNPSRTHQPPSGTNRDWNFALGGRLRPDMFPAKFTFDPAAPPDCTNDFVVFGLGIAGSSTQANLVGLNNLYVNAAGTGLCEGTIPNVLFAYNISTAATGKITTSPVLSLDGKKIAFMESIPGSSSAAIFHVLTWTAGQGAIGAPAPPTMTSLTVASSATTTSTDSISSPWVDYSNDTVYVGVDNGNIYKIAPVFSGTPALIGSPWPVFTAAYRPTAPVLDISRSLLMVGSGSGNLFQINTVTGVPASAVVGAAAGLSAGIVAPPIVDPTNGTTFVVDANDGVSAVIVEFDTTTLLVISEAQIGEGTVGETTTKVRLFEPAFSNNYFTDPSTGFVEVCGTGPADLTPWQYTFGFIGNQMLQDPTTFQQLSTTGGCTGATEFFNPYTVPTDAISATSISTNVLTVSASNTFTVGEQVLIQGTAETFLNGQTVTITSLIGAAPTYTGFTAAFTNPDYSKSPDTGTVSDPTLDEITATSVISDVLTVKTNNSFAVGQTVYLQGTAETFLNGQSVTVSSVTGGGPIFTGFTAGFTTADFANLADTGTATSGTDFFFFGLTGDCTEIGGAGASGFGCVVAQGINNGTTVTSTAYVDGGPSGIVVDNYSDASQASNIYLTSLLSNVAYKYTQEALQ